MLAFFRAISVLLTIVCVMSCSSHEDFRSQNPETRDSAAPQAPYGGNITGEDHGATDSSSSPGAIGDEAASKKVHCFIECRLTTSPADANEDMTGWVICRPDSVGEMLATECNALIGKSCKQFQLHLGRMLEGEIQYVHEGNAGTPTHSECRTTL